MISRNEPLLAQPQSESCTLPPLPVMKRRLQVSPENSDRYQVNEGDQSILGKRKGVNDMPSILGESEGKFETRLGQCVRNNLFVKGHILQRPYQAGPIHIALFLFHVQVLV